MRRAGAASLLLPWILAACEGHVPPPPPVLRFGDLPVAGARSDAEAAGLTRCEQESASVRCRREGVTLMGAGPFGAAVKLRGSDGRGGFRALTLWHDRDQNALQAVGEALRRDGWTLCITGQGPWGNQAVYRRAGVPVRVSMDLSYYMKRRLRLLPEAGAPPVRCEAVLTPLPAGGIGPISGRVPPRG